MHGDDLVERGESVSTDLRLIELIAKQWRQQMVMMWILIRMSSDGTTPFAHGTNRADRGVHRGRLARQTQRQEGASEAARAGEEQERQVQRVVAEILLEN